jgi:hypothetical protein
MNPEKEPQPNAQESFEASMKRAHEAAQAAQQQILEGVIASQKQILESIRAWTKATVPPQGNQLPGAPAEEDVQKLVDETFDFHEKLLASQREFAHELVAASTSPREAGGEGAQG